MIQDLHSHTYYSFCGKDKPEEIVEAAIAGGVELFGITDHNYGIGYGRRDVLKNPNVPVSYEALSLQRYYDHISLIKEKYADKIEVLRGIEINADRDVREGRLVLPEDADVSFFDYCLVENPDRDNSLVNKDLFSFAERCGTAAVGVAHTDMFSYICSMGEDPYRYFKRMAEQNIFWEMNVSYDSIHGYREHEYVGRFLSDELQQEIVRQSGVRLSVGFDGHRVEDYRPDRVVNCCERLKESGISLVFDE
jgi:histidinol phosphatase-like PHP family hydrolase